MVLTRTNFVGLLLLFPAALAADEGMWLFTDPPRKELQERYQFTPTDQWLEHLQKSSIRFNSGGSGSFVSSKGLVITNHHVGADALQKLSTPERNLLRDGFHAKTLKEEIACLDLELNVLMSIEDVTSRVNQAVTNPEDVAASEKARRAVMSQIEKESLDKTGMRSDVVTLFQGGRYHLYRYKKYTDVRLVFAPEIDIAFFGGDPDNFEFPRYCLDVCFFRVYESGQPAKIDHFLAWSPNGSQENELVFVSGHPGKTNRLNTIAHLEYLRDKQYPRILETLFRREVAFATYADRSLENSRRASDELFGVRNSRKARLGGLAGLQDSNILAGKRKAEDELRQRVQNDAALKAKFGHAWSNVEQAIGEMEKTHPQHWLIEQGGAFNSDLFFIARAILRLVEETEKPNGERLREYRDSNLESFKQQLFSPSPIYADLETVKLADSLSMLMEKLSAEHPLVVRVLDSKPPRTRASELVRGTKLADPEVRKQLVQGGKAAVHASTDPMIQLARLVDGPARELRQKIEQHYDEPLRQAYARIADARLATLGATGYPDATFTLRLAFGTVKGYEEDGKQIAPYTVVGGAYEHAKEHGDRPPFQLPASWIKAKEKLDLKTPMNFVSTADIIGGNSGSPVVNKAGEFVGIIFDGNIQSLVLDFAYSDDIARAVSVDSRVIVEALRKIYEAAPLADELGK